MLTSSFTRKANKKMMQQMAKLQQEKFSKKRAPPSPTKSASAPEAPQVKPGAKVAKRPVPKLPEKGKPNKPVDEPEEHDDGLDDEGDDNVPKTDAAAEARLRRLCEKKPSGRCHVSDDVHARWLKGGVSRSQLLDELKECGFKKECNCCETWFFVSLPKCPIFLCSIGRRMPSSPG